MTYSIVIPTYNHCEDLLKPCLESIVKHTDLDKIEIIVIANGCVDETPEYLAYMAKLVNSRGGTFKYEVHEEPLGYAKSTNCGIRLSTRPKVILLNNDTTLLDQEKNAWLAILNRPFDENPKCGISCIVEAHSPQTGQDFAIFFCVMIKREVFDDIGLLNEEYGKGGGEDTEFSILAKQRGWELVEVLEKHTAWAGMWGGGFPIYHKGEGTVHDPSLVPDWNDVFWRNGVRLARKFKNAAWYAYEFGGDQHRYVAASGHDVEPKAAARYKWVASNLIGNRVLEVGCSNGYGTQFLPKTIDYTGIDNDEKCIAITSDEKWGENFKFAVGNIYDYYFTQYDAIIALNFIHLFDSGLKMISYLQEHCKQLFISVPYKNRSNTKHCKLFDLDEGTFVGWKLKFLSEDGSITDDPNDATRYMLCEWRSE